MTKVTSVEHLQHAKTWLNRAIDHLQNGREEDAETCIRYAVQDEKRAVEKLSGESRRAI